jgi:hypothetical protein
VSELEASATAAPTPATARKPDPAIDPPPPMPATRFMQLAQMTPKQAYRNARDAFAIDDSPPPHYSSGGAPLPRPRFTPKVSPISEDVAKPAGGGRISSTEYMARGIAEAEAEKRRMQQKAREKTKVGIMLRNTLIFGRSGIFNISAMLFDKRPRTSPSISCSPTLCSLRCSAPG